MSHLRQMVSGFANEIIARKELIQSHQGGGRQCDDPKYFELLFKIIAPH